MVPKPGCSQFLLSCECVNTWHKEPMLDVKNLGVSRWWIRWELFILGKVDFFDRDNLRKLKGKRNLEAARMHTALFRKEDAKKEKVYALNTGNSNDMGLLWLWGKQLQLGAKWSIRDWDFFFSPRGVIARIYISFGLADNHWAQKKQESYCQLKHLKLLLLI